MQYEVATADAVSWLASQRDMSADLVITDLPYESLEKHRAVGTTTRLKHSKASSNDWFTIFPNSRFPELFSEIHRILKKDRHFYFFCDQPTMFVAKPLAEAAGFTFRKALVWDKVTIGMGYSYRARHEMILYFEKGKRRLNDLGVADVLPFRRVVKGRPAEKPVELLRVLIKQSTKPGERVADPFCGAGSTGEAALLERRKFIGCDLEQSCVSYTRARLEAL